MLFTLHRAVHSSVLGSAIASRSPSGRYHSTAIEAKNTAYMSLALDTCRREVEYHLGVPLQNMVGLTFEVELERVVDLTHNGECSRHGADLLDLITDEYGVPQELASRLRREGVQAIIVPSARDLPDGKNVVLFLENLDRSQIHRTKQEPLEETQC